MAFSFVFNALIADQLTKQFFFANQDLLTGSWLAGLLRFVEHRNYGISFNLPLPLFLTVLVTLVVVGFAWKRFLEIPKPKLMTVVGVGLLTGGALGNLFDRLWLGYVRDWLLLGGRSAVNLADGFVILGLVLLLISMKVNNSLGPSCIQEGS